MGNADLNITARKKEIIIFTLAIFVAVVLGFFDTTLPWYLTAAGLIGGAIFIGALRQPMWGLLLLIFFLPFERLGALEAGGLTVRISQIMLVVTAVAWFIRLIWRREYLPVRNPLLIPLALFLLAGVFSLAGSPNLTRSIVVIVFTLFTAFLTFLVPMLVTDRMKANKVVIFLIISFVIVAAFGLFQFLGDMLGFPTSLTGLRDLYTKDVLGFTRVQSTAYEPLYFANFLLIPLALIFALFLSGRNIMRSGWLIILFGLGMVNLVLTSSRGGYMAIVASLVVVAIFYLRKVFSVRNIIIFCAVLVVVGWVVIKTLGAGGDFFTIEKFQEHIGNAFYGASYDERIETFDQAIAAWREQPWLGIGVGGFGPYVAPHPDYMPKDGWKIVNNEFLEILAETGIIGIFFFGLFIIVLLVRSLKAIMTTKDVYLRALLVGSLGAFVGILVQYQTFSTLYIMHVWFLIGFMVALQNIVLGSVKADHSLSQDSLLPRK